MALEFPQKNLCLFGDIWICPERLGWLAIMPTAFWTFARLMPRTTEKRWQMTGFRRFAETVEFVGSRRRKTERGGEKLNSAKERGRFIFLGYHVLIYIYIYTFFFKIYTHSWYTYIYIIPSIFRHHSFVSKTSTKKTRITFIKRASGLGFWIFLWWQEVPSELRTGEATIQLLRLRNPHGGGEGGDGKLYSAMNGAENPQLKDPY